MSYTYNQPVPQIGQPNKVLHDPLQTRVCPTPIINQSPNRTTKQGVTWPSPDQGMSYTYNQPVPQIGQPNKVLHDPLQTRVCPTPIISQSPNRTTKQGVTWPSPDQGMSYTYNQPVPQIGQPNKVLHDPLQTRVCPTPIINQSLK